MSTFPEMKLGELTHYEEVVKALKHPALEAMQGAIEKVFAVREEGLIVPLSSGEKIDLPDLPLVSTQGMQIPYWLFPQIGALVPNRKSEIEVMQPIFKKIWGLGISFHKKADGAVLKSIGSGETIRLRFDFNQVRSRRVHHEAQQLVLGQFLGVTPLEPDEINVRQRESLGALMVLSFDSDYFSMARDQGFLIIKTLFGRSRIELVALPGRFLKSLVLDPRDIDSINSLYVLSAQEIQVLLGRVRVEEGSKKIDLPAIAY